MIISINRGQVIQIFISILACFPAYFAGLYAGWTSPMVTHFSTEATTLQSGPMTLKEISLMSSLLYLGSLLGALISGWLVNVIGRKWSLLIWMIPQVAANILILAADGPMLLFISRVLSGTSAGSSLVVPSIFIAEIVEDNLKATVGTFIGVIFNIGIFYSKFITSLWGIYAVPISIFPHILIISGCFLMFPDTPEYLLFCKKENEAEKSLKFYRGVPSIQPLSEVNALEFEKMKTQATLKDEITSITLQDFRGSTTILAIIVSFVLNSTINFAGVRVTPSFTEVLIKDSGIPMNLSTVDTSISSLQIIGCFLSTYIVGIIGIRLSLMIYFLLSFIGLLGVGIHYFLHNSGIDLEPLTWSFLVFLSIAIVVPSTGLNNLCVGVPPMILPLKIRGIVLGTFSVFSLIIAVFVIYYYLYLMEAIGNSTILMSFSVWCLLGVIFTYFFIPEVNKMTYAEIVSSLSKRLPRGSQNSS